MTTEGGGPGQNNDRKLDGFVRDANEYYNYLRRKHVSETRLDVVIVSLVVWFASFAVLGITSLAITNGGRVPSTMTGLLVYYLLASFLVGTVIAVAAGIATFVIKRRRGLKLAELGAMLNKMKGAGVTSEDGLHLMDAMHQAALVAKKRKVDTAFEYGAVAFILVGLIGSNAAVGLLAGVIVYLYFRSEAIKDREREERRYEDSKKELLQSL
jgi:hypothetical protein